MLSYEDSKRLKELGYPQELKKGDWYWDKISEDTKPHLGLSCKHVCQRTRWFVRVPTTDGMIEGLGDDFFRLDHCVWDIVRAYPKKPTVFSHFGAIYRKPYGGEQSDIAVTGDSPDQALCELWKKVKNVPPSE